MEKKTILVVEDEKAIADILVFNLQREGYDTIVAYDGTDVYKRQNQYCGVFRYESDGVTFYFIDNEYYFARGQVYGEYDDAERFAYFSKAVLEVLPDLEWKPDVINCNDWQSALVPVYYTVSYTHLDVYKRQPPGWNGAKASCPTPVR